MYANKLNSSATIRAIRGHWRAFAFINVFMLFGLFASAQSPVDWTYSAKKVGDNVYEVRVTAEVDEPWKIYSQQTPDGGPLATSIKFSMNPLVKLEGKVKEIGDLKIYHEEVFGVDVYAYSKKVEFVQLVKLRGKAKTHMQGSIEYMACTDEQCLPPATVNFAVALD